MSESVRPGGLAALLQLAKERERAAASEPQFFTLAEHSQPLDSAFTQEAEKRSRGDEGPQLQRVAPKPLLSPAPVRDFMRVANSTVREAIPEGLFTGKGKQLYDFLYSKTRGAVVPAYSVRIPVASVLAGAGMTRPTFRLHLERLRHAGLVVSEERSGVHGGNLYTVYLPEEVAHWRRKESGNASDNLPPELLSDALSLTPVTPVTEVRNLPLLQGKETYRGNRGCNPLVSNGYAPSKTSCIRHDDDDDNVSTRSANLNLNGLGAELTLAAEAVCVPLSNSRQEAEKWRLLGKFLGEELRQAAQKTDHISSVPAFLTEHLRRQLKHATQKPPTQKQSRKTDTSLVPTPAPARKSITVTPQPRSSYNFEVCSRYAEHLQKNGHGINNPGGLATSLYRTGLADTRIAQFLASEKPTSSDQTENTIQNRLTPKAIAQQTENISTLLDNQAYTLQTITESFGVYLHPDDWHSILASLEIKQKKQA